MLFYIDQDDLPKFNILNLKLPTEDDIFCYEYFKNGFLKNTCIKYIPIYIHPLFNLDTLQAELLLVYFREKPMREIKMIDDIYTFVSIIGLHKKSFDLPFLYARKDKFVIRVQLYFDSVQIQRRKNRYTDNFFFIGYCTDNINVNLLDSLKVVNYEDKYYITIFGSPYYLYPFLKLAMPSDVDNLSWTSANYYYNNNLAFDSIEVQDNKHLVYKTEDEAKFALTSIESILFLNKLN